MNGKTSNSWRVRHARREVGKRTRANLTKNSPTTSSPTHQRQRPLTTARSASRSSSRAKLHQTQQGGTLVDETIHHRCRCPFCLFLEDGGRDTRSPMVKIPELRRRALEDCLICRTVSAVFFAFPNTLQDAVSVDLCKFAGLYTAWYIDDSLAPLSRQRIATIDLFTLLGKSLRDGA